jgi:hypothetical protein
MFSFPSVAAQPSAGTMGLRMLFVISHNFSCSAPTSRIIRVVWELKEEGTCSMVSLISSWMRALSMGISLPSWYTERRRRTASMNCVADILGGVVEKLDTAFWRGCDGEGVERKGRVLFILMPTPLRIRVELSTLDRRAKDAMSWMENARKIEARKSQRGICIVCETTPRYVWGFDPPNYLVDGTFPLCIARN